MGKLYVLALPPFRSLDETELQRLDDDALVEYMRRARAAGDPSAGLALAILVFGHWHNVERRVRMKVPDEHVEELTGDIVVDAIASSFGGSSVGEFRAWLHTIVRRAIADFFRRGPGRVTVERAEAAEPAAVSDAGVVELLDAVERVKAPLRPDHRRVIEIMLFEGGTAATAARELRGMTEDNAHQIVSRFRRALRRELREDSEGG
jgi:DNA-directed RNA polymerase specialized sigma24 family protein